MSVIAICIIGISCKKHETTKDYREEKNSFVDSIAAFLQNQLSPEEFHSLNFSSAIELIRKNEKIGLQCFIRNRGRESFLMIRADDPEYEGIWVDMKELSIQNGTSSGQVILHSLDRALYQELYIENNAVTEILTNDPSKINFLSPSNSDIQTPAELNNVSPVLPEIIVYHSLESGYAVEYASLYWLFGGNSTYTNFYYTSYSGTGGSTNNGAGKTYYDDNVHAVPSFISPDYPIADLIKELKCFTIDATSIYTVSINVNQPNPRSRDIVNAFSDFPVGHTFFTLQQQTSTGNLIIRNLGFYPKNQVKPGTTTDEGIFGEDSNTPFAVSLKFDVNSTEFQRLSNTIISQQTSTYDLDNFNCTNEVMNTMKAIGILLPSTSSTSALFDGNNPADLAEDIRQLDLNKFSLANGNRKFIRTVSNFNDQKPPVKKGSCGLTP